MVQRYLHRLKMGYITSFAFRAELILWLLLDTVPVLIVLLVWTSIYQNHTEISGYSVTNILNYYTLVLLIDSTTSSHFEQYRVEQIRLGKIDHFFTRPLSYIQEIFLGHVSGKLFYFTISLPFFALVLSLLSQFLPLALPELTIVNVTQFLGLMLYTFSVEFLIGLIIVMLGFWFEGSQGLEHFKWMIVTLLSGWMIPIEMMPLWLRSITEALPFKYMYTVPIQVIQSQQSLILIDVMIMLGFLGLLIFCSKVIWYKARLKYTSAGG